VAKVAIEVYNHPTLKKRVTELVQSSMAAFIPKAEFRKMVDREVKEYFETKSKMTFRLETETIRSGYYNNHEEKKTGKVVISAVTPFRATVWLEVDRICQAKLKAYMKTQAFQDGADFNTKDKDSIEDYLQAKVDALAPLMIETWARGLVRDGMAEAMTYAENQAQKVSDEIRNARLGY